MGLLWVAAAILLTFSSVIGMESHGSAKEWLYEHNWRRCMHGALPLRWDQTVALKAQVRTIYLTMYLNQPHGVYFWKLMILTRASKIKALKLAIKIILKHYIILNSSLKNVKTMLCLPYWFSIFIDTIFFVELRLSLFRAIYSSLIRHVRTNRIGLMVEFSLDAQTRLLFNHRTGQQQKTQLRGMRARQRLLRLGMPK